MKEHPIIMSAPSVLALLEDRKHVTRRLSPIWMKVKAGDRLWVRETWASPETDKTRPGRIAYNSDGVCGCWIGSGEDREFIYHGRVVQAEGYNHCFPATGADSYSLGKYTDLRSGEYPSYRYGWRSSMFMPRWASRILLECEEDARRERLRAITDEDAVLEGCPGELDFTPAMQFAKLWSTLHTKPGERWQDNPEVTRVGRFRRVA